MQHATQPTSPVLVYNTHEMRSHKVWLVSFESTEPFLTQSRCKLFPDSPFQTFLKVIPQIRRIRIVPNSGVCTLTVASRTKCFAMHLRPPPPGQNNTETRGALNVHLRCCHVNKQLVSSHNFLLAWLSQEITRSLCVCVRACATATVSDAISHVPA